MDVIVGTAGHIDHGKTALVKALTGVDADRLPEEKRRGITVDLGFAELTVADAHFGFVDVPGHERFVKNMLAGASGIDIVMLVVAADEGVMPQTREHFDICRLLGVDAGLIALTKTDLVDAETLELAKLDAAELIAGSFLENAPIVEVSSRNGNGIEQLKNSLVDIAGSLPDRKKETIMRLPIDRSFSVKGFGAVVTGTLASGNLCEGDDVELLPSRAKVRVRGIQTHGKSVKSATGGRRVAVNLGGIDHSKLERGMSITEAGVLEPSQAINAEIEVVADAAKPLRTRQRIRLHIGTVEALARLHVLNESGEIEPGGRDLVQIRLETPVATIPGERFIIRRYSPQITIAGGTVIENNAARFRRRELAETRDRLASLLRADTAAAKVSIIITSARTSGVSLKAIRARTGYLRDTAETALQQLLQDGSVREAGERYISDSDFGGLLTSTEKTIDQFHAADPLAKGIGREALRDKVFGFLPDDIFQGVLAALTSAGKIVSDRETIRSSEYKLELSPEEKTLSDAIRALFVNAGLEVPKFPELLVEVATGTKFGPAETRKFFQTFLDSGEIVKVSEEFYFHRRAIEDLTQRLRQYADSAADRTVDMARFKEIAGVSRKYAIPLIEYFDRERITVRRGDARVII